MKPRFTIVCNEAAKQIGELDVTHDELKNVKLVKTSTFSVICTG